MNARGIKIYAAVSALFTLVFGAWLAGADLVILGLAVGVDLGIWGFVLVAYVLAWGMTDLHLARKHGLTRRQTLPIDAASFAVAIAFLFLWL